MPASDPGARYTRTAIVLHWLIAVLVLGQVAWGWWMQEIPKQPVGPRVDAFNLHKSVGMTLFALMTLRLAWRIGHPPPALPAMAPWQSRLAHVTHIALYVALLIQPVAGYLGSEFSGYPVKFFGITLPGWAGKDIPLKDFLGTVHLCVGWVITALIALHVAGAAKHALIDRDGLPARMSLVKGPRG